MNCRIGSPGVKITSSDQSQQLFQQLTESKMKFPSMNLKLPFQGQNKAQTDITVNSIAMGTQDETWGSPVSLQGHLGYVCIFHEAIQLGQVQSLHNLGRFPQVSLLTQNFTGPMRLGLHTGPRELIGTETHFEKNQYFTVSLRTGTKRHRFVF